MHRRTLRARLPAALAACVGPTGTALTRAERSALRIASFRVDPSAGDDRTGGPELRKRIVPDLAEALRSEFSDRADPTGWIMQVGIGVLDVVGGTATATGRGRSQLSPTLRLIEPGGTLRASIPLIVTAGAARDTLTGTAIGAITGGRATSDTARLRSVFPLATNTSGGRRRGLAPSPLPRRATINGDARPKAPVGRGSMPRPTGPLHRRVQPQRQINSINTCAPAMAVAPVVS